MDLLGELFVGGGVGGILWSPEACIRKVDEAVVVEGGKLLRFSCTQWYRRLAEHFICSHRAQLCIRLCAIRFIDAGYGRGKGLAVATGRECRTAGSGKLFLTGQRGAVIGTIGEEVVAVISHFVTVVNDHIDVIVCGDGGEELEWIHNL